MKEIYALTETAGHNTCGRMMSRIILIHITLKKIVFGHHIHSLDEISSIPMYRHFLFIIRNHEIAMAQHNDCPEYSNNMVHEIEAYQNNQHIDLAMKGCSKGTWYQDHSGLFSIIRLMNIYGIGDNYNDLPMLEAIQA